jgi:prepilin-type N-terminal cleavage/methylation domain-containing protein
MNMKKRLQGAFTLVELLVAIGIFSILIAVAIGGFVHALRTQREVASIIGAQSNASIALESMARELRTGYLFCNDPANNGSVNDVCAPACSPSVTLSGTVWTCDGLIDFYNANGANVDYALDENGSLARSDSGSTGTFVPITGNNVKVTYLTFTIFGNKEGDNWPPRITVSMGVVPNSTDPALVADEVELQTTVSARTIDCTAGGAC